jgi:TolA-binding protein
VAAKVSTRSTDQVRNLEAASKAAFESVNRQLDVMNERLERVESGFERLENGLQAILNLLQSLKAATPAAASNNAPAVAAAAAPTRQEGKFVVCCCCRCCLPMTLTLFYFILLLPTYRQRPSSSSSSSGASQCQRRPASYAPASAIQHQNAAELCSPPCGVAEQGVGGVPECRFPRRLRADPGVWEAQVPLRLCREDQGGCAVTRRKGPSPRC